MATDQGANARVGTLTQIGIVAKYSFLNYFRARRFYVLLLIDALIGGLLTVAIAYYRPPGLLQGTALGFYAAGWGFATILVIVSTALFGGDAISSEFQNRTGYFLVPNPIRRSAIYVGKWLAALAASVIILLIYAAMIIANGLYYFPSNIPMQFPESIAFALLFTVSALSLMFLFSSVFKNSAVSIVMGILLLLLIFDVVDVVLTNLAGIEPWFSITYADGIIGSVMNSTYPLHFQSIQEGRFAISTWTATIPEGLIIMAAYFVVSAILGLVLFEKKEFTS
jgi:ABC-2 type transport system permease protein